MRMERWKFTALATLYVLACGIYMLYLYAQAKQAIDDNINNKLYFSALATSAILGDTYHDNLIDKQSKTSEEDWAAIQKLTRYNKQAGLSFIYTVIRRDSQAYLISSSASEEELRDNDYVRFFDPYPDVSPALLASLDTGRTNWVDYTDHWGEFRAVFVPLKSRDGTPYVAGAEISLLEYNRLLRHEALALIGFAILTFAALAVLLALYLLRMRLHLHQLQGNEEALEKARVAAESASRAKSEFLATMSHEIRTPMNGIIGAAELMKFGRLDEQQREYLGIIQSSGQSLLTMINDILDLSKIESGKLELDNRRVELRPVIWEVVELLRPSLKSDAVTLGSEIAAEVPEYVVADPQRLRQVLINLLGNAVKFTASGRVTLSVGMTNVTNDEAELLFQVRDTGIGIPPDQLQLLFQPFTQVDTSASRRFGGTGLGLSICKRLVNLMGGQIQATSQLGQGSVFSFTLPADDVNDPAILEKSLPDETRPLPHLPPLRVLVAEDNPVNQTIAHVMLRKLGLQADLVDNGNGVLSACQARTYDLILMDVNMPGMDGLEATQRLRTLTLPHQPYIIAFTANAFSEERERCLAAGMNDYLTKPLRMHDLADALQRAARQIQARYGAITH
ncbi:MAG TPA: ATP-binding protein [Dongiaceae bacterium]|nr:ATP-binding protein [Dongiaceae bacterium]